METIRVSVPTETLAEIEELAAYLDVDRAVAARYACEVGAGLDNSEELIDEYDS